MIDVGPRAAARDRVEHPPLVRDKPVELLAHHDLALLAPRPPRSLGIKFRDAFRHALPRSSTPHVSVDWRWGGEAPRSCCSGSGRTGRTPGSGAVDGFGFIRRG